MSTGGRREPFRNLWMIRRATSVRNRWRFSSWGWRSTGPRRRSTRGRRRSTDYPSKLQPVIAVASAIIFSKGFLKKNPWVLLLRNTCSVLRSFRVLSRWFARAMWGVCCTRTPGVVRRGSRWWCSRRGGRSMRWCRRRLTKILMCLFWGRFFRSLRSLSLMRISTLWLPYPFFRKFSMLI